MNELILTPTDVLQLRDARPMAGSLAGHTMCWPTPDLITHALRAALHRSELVGHVHCYHPRGQARNMQTAERRAKFGSVLHAGPFPVQDTAQGQKWFFPCPLDVELKVAAPTGLPSAAQAHATSLPRPLRYAVVSLCAPNKENRAPVWFSAEAWAAYAAASDGQQVTAPDSIGIGYSDVAETEHHYGIGLDDTTGAVQKGLFYSAESLRLKPGWHIGSWVSSAEKDGSDGRRDVVNELFATDNHIVVGGQQRVCTAKLNKEISAARHLPPLPQLSADTDGKVRVKWALITPAIWSRHGNHPGGWLPTWVDAESGRVLLKSGNRARGQRENRAAWRARLKAEGCDINAALVAAVVGKPQVVTGYATAGRTDGDEGPKCTHSAVPAGSVYYFECDSPQDAEALCKALHATAVETLNRRSELLGEQGYGIGLCTAWHFAESNN